MCHCHCHNGSHRHKGLFLIVLGVIVIGGGLFHRYYYPCHSEQIERHIAEVCLKAAEGVQK